MKILSNKEYQELMKDEKYYRELSDNLLGFIKDIRLSPFEFGNYMFKIRAEDVEKHACIPGKTRNFPIAMTAYNILKKKIKLGY
jgi:hypothetical protein